MGGRGRERETGGEDLEELELLCIVGRNVNGATTVKNSMSVPKKIKNRSTT